MRLVLVLVLVLVLDGLAAAGDYVWDPSRRPSPRAGTKFAEELEMSAVISKTLSHPGEEPTPAQTEQSERFRLVHSISEVSPEGVTAEEIKVEKWNRAEKGKMGDSSLEGQRIVVKGAGGDRTFTVEGANTPTGGARKWIELDLCPKSGRDPGLDELDWSCLLPKDKVKDGEGWKLAPQDLVASLVGKGGAIDPAKSSATGRLTAVKVVNGIHVGHIEIAVDMALTKTGEVTWTEGTIQKFRYVLDASLEPDKRNDLSGTISIALRGKGTARHGVGSMEIETDQTLTFTLRRAAVE